MNRLTTPNIHSDDHEMQEDSTNESRLDSLIERSDWSMDLSTSETVAPGTMSSIEITSQFGTMGGSPLHFACQRRAPSSAISELLQANPAAASTTCGPENRLPIHDACSARASRDSIRSLLRAFPGGAMTAKSDGSLPIHIACETQPDHDVVEALIAAFPQGLCAKNALGRLPIHVATANRAAHQVIELLLQRNPSSAFEVDSFGYLPLHLPFIAGGSLEAVEPLFRANPAGVSVAGANGDLPIHSACFWDTPPQAVNFLVAQFPQGLCVRNNDGYLPLHAAVEHDAPNETLKTILKPYPEALFLPHPHNTCSPFEELRERDQPGRAPFASVLREIFSSGSDACRDARGRSLLHVVCTARAAGNDTEMILAQHREQAKLQDSHGRLPLHIVAAFGDSRKKYPSLELVMDLIQAHPDGLRTPTKNSQLPFAIACASDVSLDVLYALLRQHPEAICSLMSCNMSISM